MKDFNHWWVTNSQQVWTLPPMPKWILSLLPINFKVFSRKSLRPHKRRMFHRRRPNKPSGVFLHTFSLELSSGTLDSINFKFSSRRWKDFRKILFTHKFRSHRPLFLLMMQSSKTQSNLTLKILVRINQ